MSDDDLTPSEPEKSSNEISGEFDHNSEGKKEQLPDKVPDMVRDDAPEFEPRPTLEGTEDVDRDHFNKSWNNQLEKYSQHQETDSFDKTDIEKEWGDRLGRDQGKERGR